MNKALLLLLLSCTFLQAQRTISGTFSPAKDYTWLIAYHLKPGTQNYIADAAIEDGKFTLKIPENKPAGIYRMVYAVPQEEFYFDVIYTGKEDIELNFTSSEGVEFIRSTENIPFGTYFKEVNEIEQELVTFYTSGNTDTKVYKNILKRLSSLQKTSEEQTKDLMATEFITANRPYIPSGVETLSDYVSNRKKHYFDGFEISNTTLQASGFLTDKLLNYVFTALPLKQMSDAEMQMAMQENVQTLSGKLNGVNEVYQFSVFYTLWSQAAASSLNQLSDFVFETYLKDLALKTNNLKTVTDIEVNNRLRLGAPAPEISWEEDKSEQKLSTLEGAEHYILVFWSSTCGHCLKELPALHKELRKYPDVKILAVGLEEDDVSWANEIKKLPNFTHALALGKWDNKYADLYNITATPTYFILDGEKRILAKPESDKDVVSFLKEQ